MCDAWWCQATPGIEINNAWMKDSFDTGGDPGEQIKKRSSSFFQI